MFFISKQIWWFLSPLNLLLIFIIIGLFFKIINIKFLYKTFMLISLVFFIIVGFFPTGNILLSKLEKNYPELKIMPKAIDGILILGGPSSPSLTKQHNQVSFNEAGERLTESIKLINMYQPPIIIFSGGSGSTNPQSLPHTFVAKQFFTEMGIDINKIIFESKSNNTYENILFSKNLIKPTQSQKWLLVTSAFHMTRAINVAEKLGWQFIPYSVDFRTGTGSITFKPSFFNALNNFKSFDLATHEIFGLICYYLLGRTTRVI